MTLLHTDLKSAVHIQTKLFGHMKIAQKVSLMMNKPLVLTLFVTSLNTIVF